MNSSFFPINLKTGKKNKCRASHDEVQKSKIPTLVKDSAAYIRIKEYKSKPLKEITPKGEEASFNFGQKVTLIKKYEALPTMWLVSNKRNKSWVPAYMLTLNKKEIDFLRKKKRIPESMSYVFVKDNMMYVSGQWKVAMGGGNFMLLNTNHTGIPVSSESSNQFAVKGNAVLFTDLAIKHNLIPNTLLFLVKVKLYIKFNQYICFIILVMMQRAKPYLTVLIWQD